VKLLGESSRIHTWNKQFHFDLCNRNWTLQQGGRAFSCCQIGQSQRERVHWRIDIHTGIGRITSNTINEKSLDIRQGSFHFV